MDIKNKFPPSPPKGAGADAKKNQDVVNTKVYPQKKRKRELTGASNFSKNEQPRKWNVQKAKDTVKRPRAKGQYHGSTEENTKVVAAKWAEPGSVLVHGCKKENYLLNGNHLLNFHYEPRNAHNRNMGKSMRSNHNSNRWLPPIQRHKYNKEQFLQASCQFVVIAGGDYSLYWTNPDVLVDWKSVEQIKVRSSENLSCPICLCPPIAGKMTRCGHVYCWPCILHYIDVSDKKDASCKCPICYATVYKNDLKSMIEITQTTFNLGDTLNLRLMRRERGSVLAIPVKSTAQTSPTIFLSVSENSDNQIYSKLLIASVQDIINIIEFERVQLKLEYDNYPDCYIKQALNELSQRKNELLLKASEDSLSMEDITEKKVAQQTSRENEVNTDACCKNDTEFLETAPAEQSSKIVDSASNDNQCASGPSRFIYFYQADDGQHLYLHAMNVKMLEMQYGDLEHCPSVITGKLLEKEAGSYTEDLKRRLRYLCHLPLTCQFELAEIELRPPLVSDHVLHAFRDQLNLRKERRQRREREEKKRDKKITEEQNKRMGKYPTPNINIESNRHFPQWNPELLFSEQHALSSPEPTTMSSIASSSSSSSTFDEVAAGQENISLLEHSHEQQQGPSFAEMLRNTRTPIKSTNAWPSVTSIPSRTRSGAVGIVSNEDEDVEEAYYASPPSNNQCLGDALARALEQTRLDDSGEAANTTGKKNKKQKKKKTKRTVLFATGMTCAS
ncbi:RING finger protein 10 [Harpegnathos saltator]|uniref:E3 ubiquitin-protein ligase RNF10 n=1 Tax=Harpegnathos saltator TaxID=610380 RepID=E2BED4_HARSA|nr:RING finger protein 10 [Harpegnathos saltator]EFN85979.1 RING finger protein 10 [Harpegnathos saltator]